MNDNDKNVYVLKQAAEYILVGNSEEAGTVIREFYPFIPNRGLLISDVQPTAFNQSIEISSALPQTNKQNTINREKRKYTEVEQMTQFFQDGFIDRYFGTKLINSGLLRLLSEKLPEEFPYHPHWKMDACHQAYWDYQPTMDHLIANSIGGKNELTNWVTTSMKWNMAKNNYTLEQMNWQLYPEGDIHEWDGLSRLFVEIVEKEPKLKRVKRINDWYKATKTVLKNYSL